LLCLLDVHDYKQIIKIALSVIAHFAGISHLQPQTPKIMSGLQPKNTKICDVMTTMNNSAVGILRKHA